MRNKFKTFMVPILLIMLIPQFVNVLTCVMMSDKQLKEIPTAVYLGDNTALTRSIVNYFDENDTFDVVYYVDSPEEIEKLMTEGRVYYGLSIPPNFTSDVKSYKTPTINTVIDGTQLSSASFTKITSSEILLSIKTGAMKNLFQGKFSLSETEAMNMAMPIGIRTRLLGNPTRNYVNFLLPGMMTALVQVGLAMNATTAFNKEERKKFSRVLFRYLGGYSLIGFLSLLCIVFVQNQFFDVAIKASLMSITVLTALFAMAVTSVGLLIASAFSNKVLATQVGAIFFIPSSIISGYTWPVISMPPAIKSLSRSMPFTYYGDTLRDLLLKGRSDAYNQNLSSLVMIIAFSLIGAYILNYVRIHVIRKERNHGQADTGA